MYFSNCIFQNVFLKMYFSKCRATGWWVAGGGVWSAEFFKMYFSRCISQNVFLKLYFSKCISQNIFLKMYFSKCVSQNDDQNVCDRCNSSNPPPEMRRVTLSQSGLLLQVKGAEISEFLLLPKKRKLVISTLRRELQEEGSCLLFFCGMATLVPLVATHSCR